MNLSSVVLEQNHSVCIKWDTKLDLRISKGKNLCFLMSLQLEESIKTAILMEDFCFLRHSVRKYCNGE
jgi:hypothetical protein